MTVCSIDGCDEEATLTVTNDETDGKIPICGRCASELTAGSGHYVMEILDE